MSDPSKATGSGNGFGEGEVRLLPSNPFRGLRFHFGQLLGVQDFRDEQGYHRGKRRLHNAWLHRDGVVWGLGVSLPEDDGSLRGEVEVAPGLALDAAGNELHLGRPMCVDVGKWFEEHRDDPDFAFSEDTTDEGGLEVRFDARVVARFRACLARPVPAMSEPCEGAEADTAHSRTLETVDLHLLPGAPDDEAAPPYRRLRLFFGLVPPREEEDGSVVPEDQEVLDAREAVAATGGEARPRALLEAFRRLAVLDEMELRPEADEDGPSRFYPVDGRPPVLLAGLGEVRLVRASEDDPWRLAGAEVDNTARPVHVATSTIQELFCCGVFGGTVPDTDGNPDTDGPPDGDGEDADPGDGPPSDTVGPPPDAGGPRIDADSVELDDETLTFEVRGSLSKNSIEDPQAVVVRGFDRVDGWEEVTVRDIEYERSRDLVTVHLRDRPEPRLVRILVRGTGEHPVLDTDTVPLAGAVGGPPGTRHDGNDFVFMFRQGS